jgi:hypothetical protein
VNVELCLRVCREVWTAPAAWFLFTNGTIVIPAGQAADDSILRTMKAFDKLIGPHGGEGSYLGDCNPMRLKLFNGWLVGFSISTPPPIFTFVGDDEVDALRLPGSPTEVFRVPLSEMRQLRIGLFGRHKRNKDVRDPKIIARSTDVPS